MIPYEHQKCHPPGMDEYLTKYEFKKMESTLFYPGESLGLSREEIMPI